MSVSSAFYLPQSATPKLEALVDGITANPGPLVNPVELQESYEQMDVRKVVASLPDEMTESDFVGILKLTMLTECATDSYSAVFQRGAQEFNAPWLARFNDEVWTPDEHTHHTPYKLMLQTLGHSEEELDREIKEVQDLHYEHCCGHSPVELTTYGIIQEYLTDNFHGMISQLLKAEAPYAAKSAAAVKRRETLHTLWYRQMTTVQVEENPEMLELVADTTMSFQMPGTRLVPQFGNRSLEWMGKANVDFSRVARDFVRNFYEVAGTMKRTGQFFLDLSSRRGTKVGPVPLSGARRVLDKIGGPGYGLVAEAVLDKFGIPRPTTSMHGGPLGLAPRMYESVRASVRRLIAKQVNTSAIIGEV